MVRLALHVLRSEALVDLALEVLFEAPPGCRIMQVRACVCVRVCVCK